MEEDDFQVLAFGMIFLNKAAATSDGIDVKQDFSTQCRGSVTFRCGSGSPDPYLWL
jgi:hypothetical protein